MRASTFSSFRSAVAASMSVFALFAGGCAAEPGPADSSGSEGTEAASTGEAVSEIVPGPVAKDTDAAVWTVTSQWADTSTPAAKKGGIAWGESSGLSWEEKFSKWISSFEKITSVNGYAQTIRFPTPWGKKMDGPVLECADTAVWLRMTFASWYHLPFYLTGDLNGKRVYMGHFGVIDANGEPVASFPHFAAQYSDFESTWKSTDRWPADTRLQAKHVGHDDNTAGIDVGDGKLPEGAGDGAYFDKLFLNKRAGYLMVLLDAYFGSTNLADGVNMFHIKADALIPGDALLERYSRKGIGHTLPIMSVDKPQPTRFRVTVASGSMPRRQASWEEAGPSSNFFLQDAMGGAGNNDDTPPVAYAALGGGIRRWRTPVLTGGRWNNVVPAADRGVYIADADLAAIAARQAIYRDLLAADSPEEKRDTALAIIASARQNLRQFPASCSTRTKREEGFIMLYEAMDALGTSRADVDAKNRTLEDYVFSELEYNKAKTCCWNSTNAAMAEIVLDYATKEKAAADAAGTCKQPTVFGAHGGSYDIWKQHAATIGRSADWKAWSEDEPCAQRDSQDDALGFNGNIAMCR